MERVQQTPAAEAEERRQIVAGLLLALEDREPGALRERDVIEAAGISPRAFHAHFAGLDACFDFACEAALDTLLTPMTASWSAPRPPAARLDAALAVLLGSLAAQPRLAELCLLHSPARQPDRRTYRRAVDAVAALVGDRGPRSAMVRSPAPRPPAPPSTPARSTPPGRCGEIMAREIVALIAARLAGGGAADLERLRPRIRALLVPSPDPPSPDPPDPPSPDR